MPGITLTTIADNAAKIAIKATSREDNFNFIKTLCIFLNCYVIFYTTLIKFLISILKGKHSHFICGCNNSIGTQIINMVKGDVSDLSKKEIYPYIVFLPPEEKYWVLKTVFGSEVPIDILKFSIKQGISKKIYQKNLMKTLPYSNKTVIKHLKNAN